MRFLDRSKRTLDLALGSGCHAPAVGILGHVSPRVDAELANDVAIDAGFTDRAAIGIDHLRDALKHQTRLFLGRHGIEKKS